MEAKHGIVLVVERRWSLWGRAHPHVQTSRVVVVQSRTVVVCGDIEQTIFHAKESDYLACLTTAAKSGKALSAQLVM